MTENQAELSGSSSAWAQRAAAIPDASASTDDLERAGLALVNERLDAEGLRGLAWGEMRYGCDRCGYSEWRELEVGVEGPPSWRKDGTYIACAFGSGKCECGGDLTHVTWADDRTYPEPRKPTELRWFRVPSKPVTYVTQGMYDNGDVIYGEGRHAFLALRAEALTLGGRR